ncbi:MAG TPA: cytochrome c oxidase subunit II [Burkholderiaceae bacterium]|nr:cytochrome c oxidase subunit II [Burkholderiaceae bacterium]
MALAVVLVLIAVAAVLFQILSPWWLTPLASNWKLMDDTLWITMWICGVVFVAINLFIAYAIWKFRHRPGHRASFEPHNKKLEWWLTGITTVGVVAMLAPGLWVYADLIDPPDDALVFEALGKQWQWRYRFPGKDGQLGVTDIRFVTGDNPYGLNPDDPYGKDDVLVEGAEVHLPVGKAIKVLQRSQDVLHNFYVPQIRIKMDLVPGLVSYFWFRPTQTGRFEVMCAEYCGVAHYNMRSHMVVASEADFDAWLTKQPTYGQLVAAAAERKAAPAAGLAAKGREIAQGRGCIACHSIDGTQTVGPTWKDLYGKSETLTTGAKVTVDDEYLRKSITEPNAQVVQGFQPIMPPSTLNEDEMAALIAYIKELSRKGETKQ